ncbi:MAG: proline--tRNA ligase [bacterium]|nr:proline--tRNA ligase [bacterium]
MSSELKNNKVEKKITGRNEDYSQWYLDIVASADLAEWGPVKGCMVIKPYGYALWEKTQQILNEKFKETGVQNAYFPIFIPEKFLNKEKDHIEGFAPEVAVVTHAGGKKLDEPLIVRPTSETIMYETFSRWIHSYRDLPLLINQWANVVRWEMRPRIFLRTVEFLWQEGHTVHETESEADGRARQMLEIYKDIAENIMAIPVITGTKSDSEKFAGAFKTYSLEAMMQDGKALQFATSHNLGQNFAKAFDVKFLDKNNTVQYGWQTSWGLSTRTIGGLIMTHSDDKGLVLPPKIASIQTVITTIVPSEKDREMINQKAQELNILLKKAGVRTHVDSRDIRPGEKYYEWEKKGVPIRIELGPRDVASDSAMLVRRDTGEKTKTTMSSLVGDINSLLNNIQQNLYVRALDYRKAKTKKVDSWDEFVKAIEEGNFVLAHWSGEKNVEAQIKEETGATIRCIPFDQTNESGKCIKSGMPSTGRVIFAKSY